jgi:hypothetical protein
MAETCGPTSRGSVIAAVSAILLSWSNSYCYSLGDKANAPLENFVAKFRVYHLEIRRISNVVRFRPIAF